MKALADAREQLTVLENDAMMLRLQNAELRLRMQTALAMLREDLPDPQRVRVAISVLAAPTAVPLSEDD